MASVLKSVTFDHAVFARELKDFQALLESRKDLSEGEDILPFFKSHEHLTAYIGALTPTSLLLPKFAMSLTCRAPFGQTYS